MLCLISRSSPSTVQGTFLRNKENVVNGRAITDLSPKREQESSGTVKYKIIEGRASGLASCPLALKPKAAKTRGALSVIFKYCRPVMHQTY